MVIINANVPLKNKRLNEIVILRSIACLSVVLLHSIKFSVGYDYNGEVINFILLTIAGMLSFGTPTFVFISALILSYTYSNSLPKGFYLKRVKFILLPYICMGLFYSVFFNYKNVSEIPLSFVFNALGNYHGWFVLVIFQFYFLHHLFIKLDDRISPKLVLFVAFVINIIYLGYFNFYQPPFDNGTFNYIWDRGYWMPFIGWFFYFAVAYYFGKNYKKTIGYLEKYKVWVFSFIPFTTLLVIYNSFNSDIASGSKRFDMVFYTINLIFALLVVFCKVKKTPSIVELISKYSYGIYLVHWFCLTALTKVIEFIGLDLGYFKIVYLFIGGIVCSIIMIYTINKLPFGKYIVGNIKITPRLKEQKAKMAA